MYQSLHSLVYRIKRTFDEPILSSASLQLCHMRGYVGLKGGGFGEGIGPMTCGKWGSQFATWDQSVVRFASCTEGHHPK
jgi:hypothetical protein